MGKEFRLVKAITVDMQEDVENEGNEEKGLRNVYVFLLIIYFSRHMESICIILHLNLDLYF